MKCFLKKSGIWVRVHIFATSCGSWPDENNVLLFSFLILTRNMLISLGFIIVFDYSKTNVVGIYHGSHFEFPQHGLNLFLLTRRKCWLVLCVPASLKTWYLL